MKNSFTKLGRTNYGSRFVSEPSDYVVESGIGISGQGRIDCD